MFRKAKQRILIWNCRFSWAIFNFEKLNFEKYLTKYWFETASFFSFLVFSVIRKKIYPLSNAYKGISSRPFPPTIRGVWTAGGFPLPTALRVDNGRWVSMDTTQWIAHPVGRFHPPAEWNTFHSKKIHRDFEKLYLGSYQTVFKNLKSRWKINLFSLKKYKIHIFTIRLSSSMVI